MDLIKMSYFLMNKLRNKHKVDQKVQNIQKSRL